MIYVYYERDNIYDFLVIIKYLIGQKNIACFKLEEGGNRETNCEKR